MTYELSRYVNFFNFFKIMLDKLLFYVYYITCVRVNLFSHFHFNTYARVAQWWSTSLPRRGSRVRSPSRALLDKKRACEKTKVFSCVLLLMDVIVVILHKKGYSPPYPIRMLSYELLCGSCYFFLFIVIFIKIVSDRNEKYFKQYRFYSSSDNSFVPPVVFHDTKGPFCLNGSVHP